MDAATLGRIPLFEGLPEEDRERIAGFFQTRTALAGDRLTTVGASGYVFFVIEEGTAEARIDTQAVGELGPGDFFGEVALLGESGRRMADVVATSPMTLAAMFGTEFRRMESEHPEVVERLRAAMRQRLEIAGLA
jgi:CRP-like cAMP-binding protein